MAIIFAALLVFVLFILQRILYRNWWDRGVSVTLAFEEDMVRAGEQVRLLEVVENRKRLPVPLLKVKFQCSRHLQFSDSDNGSVTDKYYRNDVFSIMPYRRVTRTHQIYCPKRGCYGIYGIDLVGADLFFSETMTASLASDALVYVLPKLFSVDKLLPALRRINGQVATRRYELEDPFTYRGIREYEPFDEMKTVNWKATARTGELKVNIREHTAVSSVRIFMNLEDKGILRREELLELSISICAFLTENFLREGIWVSLFSNARDAVSGQHLEMEEITDVSGMNAVYKALARLDTENSMEKFESCFCEKLFTGKEALYTVFISPDRHSDYQDVLMRYEREGQDDFLWICPVKKSDDENTAESLKDRTIFILEEPV